LIESVETLTVTIITVSYNSASSIGETLDSVSTQDYPSIEHIVVDGASTDGTGDIVRTRGGRVSRFIQEPDSGIYDAMNKGLRYAKGDLVGFLNADDVFAHAGVVSAIAGIAHRNPLADAVYGDLVYVNKNQPHQVLRRWRSGEYKSKSLSFGWMPPHPTFYVRRDRLREIGHFDDTLRISADYDFMLRCLSRQSAQAIYIPEVLVRMRAGGASNRSLTALLNKSREDLQALRANHIGGWFALMCKNFRKLPQFL
jgi:glycosyltransferase